MGEDISQELAQRMAVLLRSQVERHAGEADVAPALNEARAIVAELPEPVDPDVLEARRLVECTVHWSPQTDRDLASGKNDDTPEMRIALAAIKRGRELAAKQ